MNTTIMHSETEADLEAPRMRELIEKVRGIIANSLGEGIPFELYLFGSRARGSSSKGADIDIAIACPKLSEEVFRKIKRRIDAIRTLYSIDLIHLDRVDPEFREIVISDGKKVYG